MQPDGSFFYARLCYKKPDYGAGESRGSSPVKTVVERDGRFPVLVSCPKRLPGHRWTGAYCRKPKKVKSEKNRECPLVFLYRFPVFMTFPCDPATIVFGSGRCDSFGEMACRITATTFAFRDFQVLTSAAIIVLIRMLSGCGIKACGGFELFGRYSDFTRESGRGLNPDRITRRLAG